ncbi:hypothetical protein CEK71_11050 [Methylovulum psychrotolerans]|uniref:PepSY domain-containing protein n=2 Tax=Methylovulum psychrotolerans TaxID=1704499 RepID=A0A1Z4BZ58_9GAMM|nr:hypothetical protein CEK71_11050 [Methylovulum psychrotolerans]
MSHRQRKVAFLAVRLILFAFAGNFMKNVIRISILALLLAGKASFAEEGSNSFANPVRLTQTAAVDLAARQLNQDSHNRVLGAETEQIDDKQVHVIRVLTTQGHIRHYKFDAETGQLLN